ncbi:MAG TPA: TIGR02281 family clan AA aspartic protease [Dongiaceae bacterium]|nr:TIGR02281 family clan AA aspartic protease [Dongiaceae bacterium]
MGQRNFARSLLVGAAMSALVSLGVSTFVQAAPQVRVEGLFKGAAVLNIDGKQVMLKEGKTDASGVRLISATSREAVVEIDGKRHTMKLHSAIGGTYQQAETTQVVIRKNDNDQYTVNGSINGQSVGFLVDTGANTVAMNEVDAKRLGLQYRLDGKEAQVVTASGVSKSWVVKLDTVKVGEIQVPNVEAVVVQGGYPTQVLLGMSYLNYVKLQEQNSTLMLEKKF